MNLVQGDRNKATRCVVCEATLFGLEFRPKVLEGSATARAMDYRLHRWAALTRYLDNPALSIDDNLDEQQIRPWATGQKNWPFAGTLLAGRRSSAIMSLIQTARLNGHDPYAYLRTS